ncbi:hypothetical protein [Priestia megaterium]|uniref:hypothetical protein n=1 Tax=Priestia megaterium TaxID=1404 RepID=UPI002FFE199A
MPINESGQLNFERIMEIGASTLVESMTGPLGAMFASQLFGQQDNTQAIISQAIEEICIRLTKAIDNAFMREYIADTNSIASRLLSYQETKDVDVLVGLFADASDTVQHLRLFDTIESISSCNYISTLHLVIIRALEEHKPNYRETLTRLGKDYAQWSESKAQRIIELTQESVKDPFYYSHFSLRRDYAVRDLFGSDNCTISFFTTYDDNWATPDGDVNRIVQTEPITVPKNLFDSVVTPIQLASLTEEGKKDPRIVEAIDNLNKKALEEKSSFLNTRLDVSNGMKNTILNACKKWNNL